MSQRIDRLLADTLPEVVRSSAIPDELEQWLQEPTDATCSHCGQQGLRRYERLNGRCERCRRAYLNTVAEDEGRRTPAEDCPDCLGTGWAPVKGADRHRRCPCGELRGEDRVREDLRRIGVPPEYRRFQLESWEGQVPVAVRKFLSSPGAERVLYIHGAPGRGKTHLATAALRELVVCGERCAWRDAKELMGQLKRMLRQGRDEEYDQEVHHLRSVPVLLLDDLGRERQTDYSADEIDGLIRWRHSHGGALIVTSDWSLELLVRDLADGGRGMSWDVVSRLRGLCVELAGRDRRS